MATASPPPKPWEAAHESDGKVDIEPVAVLATSKQQLPITSTTDVIEQAAGFLRHPSMQKAPADVKRRFMVSKGLTEAQINEAVQRAGLKPDDFSAKAAPVGCEQTDRIDPRETNFSGLTQRWAPIAAAGLAIAACVAMWKVRLAAFPWSESSLTKQTTSGADSSHRDLTKDGPGMMATPYPSSGEGGDRPALDASIAVLRRLSAGVSDPIRRQETLASRLPAFAQALHSACVRLQGGCGRGMNPNADRGGLHDGASADLVHALHTLSVVINNMLLHPTSVRFRRIAHANTNMRRLVEAMPDVLRALGFAESTGGVHWEWRARSAHAQVDAEDMAPSQEPIGEDDLAELRESKTLVQKALQLASQHVPQGSHVRA